MRKIVAVLACLILFQGCYSSSVVDRKDIASVSQDKRLKVAVLGFKNQSGMQEIDKVIGSVPGIMVSEMQKTKAFRIVERERIENILEEIKIGSSGIISDESAKEIGKQLGVDAFLFGNIASVKNTGGKQTILIMFRESLRTEVTMDARLVKVETGEILSTAKTTAYIKQSKWVAFGFARLGKISDSLSVTQNCIEIACKQIASDVAYSVVGKD